ncbi:MAG: DUF998 domain-containing protein [Anaerolineales bacterium]|nr:DUF998 domain-containing protein [Anaerolineales bacterium]MCB9111785.1 DUF998 domain-containing protein [Anaerolineales bacterium]
MKAFLSNKKQLAAWAGILAPIIFVKSFLIEGWLRPGYDPLSMYVSALSLGSRGWTQISNFLIFGALLFVFTRGIAAEFPDGKASRGGLILLTIIAAGYFLSGPFVMDPMNTPLDQATVHGTIHGILGGIVFLLMPISIFVYWRRFRIDPQWQSIQGWTLVLGIICAAADILFTVVSKSPSLQITFVDWFGLIQRSVIVPFMVWIFVFALAMLIKNRQSQ